MAQIQTGQIVTDQGLRIPRSGRRGQSLTDCGASQVVSTRNPHNPKHNSPPRKIKKTKIGTWNVQSMYQGGKAHNVVSEMKRLEIDVLGISETHWPGTGQCTINEHTFYYSGNDTAHHRNGTGIIVAPNIRSTVKSFNPFSDRMLLLQLKAYPLDINIIQVYAPTADKDDLIIEDFYEQLETLIKLTKKNEVTLIMGDLNAKVGRGRVADVAGDFGLGTRNERGERLIRFCQEREMVLSNTLFKLPPRRLYTWKSPADSMERVVRNQIDYIMIPKRYKNAIKSTKTYPGADVHSDHNPLVCIMEVKLRRLKTERPINTKIDIRKLHNPDIKQKVQESLNTRLTEINSSTEEELCKWNKIKDAIEETCTTYLKQDRIKKKEWMTNEILDMMEERRKNKNKDQTKYRDIHNHIRRKIRKAKEAWLAEKCNDIEQCEKRYDYHNMHKKVRELTTKKKPNNPHSGLLDANGNLISESIELINLWKTYIEQLFDDERTNDYTHNDDISGPTILRSEVEKAIRSLKNDKKPGPDNIQGEMLKLMSETDNQILDMLTTLFNKVYNKGEIPEEWLKSTFVAIPKKPNAKHCEQHRLISLINHITKAFTKVIQNRIYTKCEMNISETQFGFRSALGTREAIFSLQVLIQRCRDMNKDVHLCFIDFSKAFDNVKHEKLIEVLRNTGIDGKDIRIIANMYWGQTAKIKIGNSHSSGIVIKKGVRQGCSLSPLLFNIYSEEIFKKALDETSDGIKMNGETINNIRYADDTVIIANNNEELQRIMQNIHSASEEYGLSLNASKTKWMIISKIQHPPMSLTIDGQNIERVETYTYLGTTVNAKWDQASEIKSRIEKARATFNNMKMLFTSKDISLQLKLRLMRCYVFSVLFYGVEAWTTTEATLRKLEAFEMWIYRRILKIPWTDHITNVEVIQRLEKKKEVVFTVKKRKLEYFGHIMRHDKYRLLQLIVQGKVHGKRGPGRRRHSWMHNLRQWYGLSSVDLFRSAVNKIRTALLIANVRNG